MSDYSYLFHAVVHVCTPLQATIYNNCLRLGVIPQSFTNDGVKFLCKKKLVWNEFNNFYPFTRLNTEIKIFAKSLINCFQTDLLSLIPSGQLCAVNDRIIQDSFLLVGTITVDDKVLLINVNHKWLSSVRVQLVKNEREGFWIVHQLKPPFLEHAVVCCLLSNYSELQRLPW